nr:MAG TPA: hypothetical protein [Caudoviricetes sp.]
MSIINTIKNFINRRKQEQQEWDDVDQMAKGQKPNEYHQHNQKLYQPTQARTARVGRRRPNAERSTSR